MRTAGAGLSGQHVPMQRFPIILAAIATVVVAGCGQTGPLYLPDTPPPKNKEDSEFDVQPARQSAPRPSDQPATPPTSRQP